MAVEILAPVAGERIGLPSGVILPFWVAEPYRLWSLLDMLRFHAETFLMMVQWLTQTEEYAFMVLKVGSPSNLQVLIRAALVHLLAECRKLPVSPTLLDQIERASKEIQLRGDPLSSIETATRLREIQKCVLKELESHYFYSVPAQHAYLLSEDDLQFGNEVNDKFPEATKDIAASGRCLALREGTACVFHSMRVLEHGLHAFARRVRLKKTRTPTPLVSQNWGMIIDRIASKIAAEERKPKPRNLVAQRLKSEKLQSWSEAAEHFRYIKNAWRNHVAHSRESYDEHEAERIWLRTRDFMQAMVKVLAR